eukprot:467448-Amphidinium_carterae.1
MLATLSLTVCTAKNNSIELFVKSLQAIAVTRQADDYAFDTYVKVGTIETSEVESMASPRTGSRRDRTPSDSNRCEACVAR